MLILAVALLLGPAPPQSPDECGYDRTAMLALSPEKFDQDPHGGWRPLADKVNCRAAAADLLASYRTANRVRMTLGELHLSFWHEGQMRAVLGDGRRAVPFLLAGVDPSDTSDFADYALGTAAFLQHDHPALESARARLARTPPPANWAESRAEIKARYGLTPSWPPNLAVLDGLRACFDKPYAIAYAQPCRPKRENSP